METSFLTIAEAMEKTGKSASTIRRIIRTIADDAKHTDRDGVQPSVKEVAAYKKKGENFAWKIREDLLVSNSDGALTQKKKSMVTMSPDILTILEKELELKNKQIEKQWEVIHALNDRLREGNILMGSLQKRLGPPAEAEAVETVTVSPSVKSSRRMFGWLRR